MQVDVSVCGVCSRSAVSGEFFHCTPPCAARGCACILRTGNVRWWRLVMIQSLIHLYIYITRNRTECLSLKEKKNRSTFRLVSHVPYLFSAATSCIHDTSRFLSSLRATNVNSLVPGTYLLVGGTPTCLMSRFAHMIPPHLLSSVVIRGSPCIVCVELRRPSWQCIGISRV